MKIAHVTATFPPYYAGTGNVCFQNASRLARMGHRVTVYTTKVRNGAQDDKYNFAVERLAPVLRVGNAPLLPGLLRLPRYDLIHLHYPFILGAEMIWLNHCLRNQPYVLTYHNELQWQQGVRGLIFSGYQRTCSKLVLEGAAAIIVTTSDFAPSSPLLRSLLETKPERVVEVSNGVDLVVFHPDIDPRPVRSRYQLADQSVILFVGAMDLAHHQKGGAPQVLSALAELGDKDVVAMLVGGGSMVETYRSLAQELGVGDQVRFTGWVSHDKIANYCAAADIIVQPSVLMEPFGMVGIEAMACGKPVVASNLPGVRRVITDGEDGLLARPGDIVDLAEKIRFLLDNPSLRRTMGEKGRAKVEHRYAWEKIIPQLAHVYKQVLGMC